MTRFILEAIQNGYSSEYLNLLHNYGLWARYFGAVGYLHPGLAHEDYIIDDDSALKVEKAMCWLKQSALMYIGSLRCTTFVGLMSTISCQC